MYLHCPRALCSMVVWNVNIEQQWYEQPNDSAEVTGSQISDLSRISTSRQFGFVLHIRLQGWVGAHILILSIRNRGSASEFCARWTFALPEMAIPSVYPPRGSDEASFYLPHHPAPRSPGKGTHVPTRSPGLTKAPSPQQVFIRVPRSAQQRTLWEGVLAMRAKPPRRWSDMTCGLPG